MIEKSCTVHVLHIPEEPGAQGVLAYSFGEEHRFGVFHTAAQGHALIEDIDAWLCKEQRVLHEYADRGVYGTGGSEQRLFHGSGARLLAHALVLCVQLGDHEQAFDHLEFGEPVSFDLTPSDTNFGLVSVLCPAQWYLHVYHSRDQLRDALQSHAPLVPEAFTMRYIFRASRQVPEYADLEPFRFGGMLAQQLITGMHLIMHDQQHSSNAS